VVVTLGEVTKPSKRDMESVVCGTTSCSSERVGERVDAARADEEEAPRCGDDLEEEEGEGEERGAFGLGDARTLLTPSAARRTLGLACGLMRGEVLDKERGRGGLVEERTFMWIH